MSDKTSFEHYRLHIDVGRTSGITRYVVRGYRRYGPNSVCAGQWQILYLASYSTEQEARQEWPQLEAGFGSKLLDREQNRMPVNPPSWFDPTIAGECWHEDDY